MASTSNMIKDPQEEGRTAKKFEENPRKLSMFGNLHLERCCWTLIHPWRALQQEKLFRLRVRVPFSVFQMIVDKFRTIPEWNIYKDPSSKRGRPCSLELKVMSSLYIFGRAATYDDDAAIFTSLSSKVIASIFHHFIVCMATLYPQWIYFNHVLQVCQAQPPHSVGDVQDKAQ